MKYFCTYFDQNYLLPGLTLYRSLRNHCPEFKLYILCLDTVVKDTLARLALEEIIPVPLTRLESANPQLHEARSNRGLFEYYITLTPVLPLFILDHYRDIDLVTYVDADIFFYSDPVPVFDELGDQSILVTEHRFSERNQPQIVHGRFSVQFQSFRNNSQGRACLERWSDQCQAWCRSDLEDGKFGDQKYLDEWPELYDQLVVSSLKGAGLAPWNLDRYRISFVHGKILVDDEDLIFYHFHAMKLLTEHLICNGTAGFIICTPGDVVKHLYHAYVNELRRTVEWLRESGGGDFRLRYSNLRRKRSLFRTMLSGMKNHELMWIS